MKHPLVNRTSPKGEGNSFVGTCAACGKQNITLEMLQADEDCENVRNMTQEEALLEALESGTESFIQ
jgi:hypothetical protein